MNMSLFDQVVNESYSADLGGYAEDKLDSATESYIDSVITDDPVTMVAFTGECMMGIMALEAAEARMEGMMAVKLMNARAAEDQEAMEAAVVTMEGFVGDVWEALKEIVKKAYTAIKTFLIKVWNKFKGYGNVVKAFFTKYGDVLRHKRVPGLRVKWERINLDGAERVMNEHLGNARRAIETLVRSRNVHGAVNRMTDGAYKHDKNLSAAHATSRVGDVALPSPHEINSDLNQAMYPDQNRSSEDLEQEFERVRSEAIEAADISSYKKYIDNFMALGNKHYQSDLKLIEDIKREHAKDKARDTGAGVGSFHTQIRRCLNAEIEIINLCTHAMATAAKRMQSQSIAACRKAIMYHSTEGAGATYADESAKPQSGATLESLMGDLGY
jgi:hypothetical protein